MNDFVIAERLLLKQFSDLHFDEIEFLSDLYNKNKYEYIYKIFKTKKILPFAALIFYKLGLDKLKWKKVYSSYAKRNSIIKNFLQTLFLKAEKRGIKSMILTENFAVLISTNLPLGCFCSSDVDLFISYEDLDKSLLLFKDFGLIQKSQNKNQGRSSTQFLQFCKSDLIDEDFWINISWKPVTRKYLVQTNYENRLLNLILKKKFITKSSINILDCEHLLYFNALHISSGHFYTQDPGIRLYVDIDRIIRKNKINWNKILQIQDIDNAGVRASLVFVICNKVLGTPIPKSIISKIRNSLIHNILLNKLVQSDNSLNKKTNIFCKLLIEIFSNSNLKFLKFNNLMQLFRS